MADESPTVGPARSARRASSTARRLVAASVAVLALFAAALLVEIWALERIADVQAELEQIERARQAGYVAALMVREQYIHQAHTIINWDESHLGHYEEVVRRRQEAAARLCALVQTDDERAHASDLGVLAERSDLDFRRDTLSAIARDDRSHVHELHEATQALVDRALAHGDILNARFESRRITALARADRARANARFITLACFGLALLVSGFVVLFVVRSITRPIRLLREGARRVGGGDLRSRIAVVGTDDLAELAATFNQMTDDLTRHQQEHVRSQTLASVGQVAAGVAHEINNPLGVILGYARLLRRAPSTDPEGLRIIEDEAVQCQRIVQGLLALARPVRPGTESVDLGEVTRDALARLRAAGTLDGRRIEVACAPEPVLTTGDEAQLRQVVGNLLTNASQATAHGGTIRASVSYAKEQALIVVEDSGPGIAAEVMPRIFDPFFTTKAEGVGLGLSIAQATVDAHGGRIEIGAASIGGARIVVMLPAIRQVEEQRS